MSTNISSFQTYKRTLKLALEHIWRNKLFAFTTIAVITLMLFILNIALVINTVAKTSLSELEQKVDIILYINDEADLASVKNLEDTIRNMEEVKSVQYTSKDEALKQFVQNYNVVKDTLYEKYQIPNPLPADLRITTHKIEDNPKVIAMVKQSEYSPLLKFISHNEKTNEQVIMNLIKINTVVGNFLWWIISIFVIATFLIIINTIHITIYSRVREIKIMKLVGATERFIKLPFILEGMIYGLCGALLSLGLLLLLETYFNFSFLSGTISLQLSITTIIVEIIASIIVGIISASIAASLYFRKYLPLNA